MAGARPVQRSPHSVADGSRGARAWPSHGLQPAINRLLPGPILPARPLSLKLGPSALGGEWAPQTEMTTCGLRDTDRSPGARGRSLLPTRGGRAEIEGEEGGAGSFQERKEKTRSSRKGRRRRGNTRRQTADPQPTDGDSPLGGRRVAQGSQEPRRAGPGGPLSQRVSALTVQLVGPGARTRGPSTALPLPWG